jgi:hypothetical protein
MKVIFLDVDGVLVLWGSAFDPTCMYNLKTIIDQTDAKIVVSSTWRLYGCYDQLLDGLDYYGIDKNRVIGKTPDISFNNVGRHVEILSWLSDNPQVKRYVIIDDDISAAIPDSPDSYFQTNFKSGLFKRMAKKVVSYLNKE